MKYVALLRGINVGGNKKMKMKKLQAVFESSGFTNVLTYINSGNIIFDSPQEDVQKLTKEVEHLILTEFGLEVPAIIKSAKEITNIVSLIPKNWENNADQRTDVLFLWGKYDKKESLRLLKVTQGVEELKYIPGALVWNLDRSQYKKSGVIKFIGSDLYKNMTARNVNTVRKLGELIFKQ